MQRGEFVLKDLSLLIELQNLDLEIDKNKKMKETLSSQMEEGHKKIAGLEEDLSHKQGMLKQTKKERREKERRIEELDLLLAKHEEEKYKVKSQEEFAALEKEISRAEKEKVEIEDVLLELMEREEELAGSLPSLEMKVRQESKDIEKKEDILKADLKNVVHQSEELENKRKEVISQLNPVLSKQYKQLRKNKDGLVVIPVKDGNCEGCNMKVSPSLIGSLRRGEEIIYCESCNRILYISQG